MLQRVLIFSALIIGAASYPLVFGPIDLSSASVEQGVVETTEATTIARVDAPSSRATVALKSDNRGHFFGEFRLNGRKTQAMVDTGATVIAINRSTARRSGITLKSADFTTQVGTANGNVMAAPVLIESVQIGRIRIQNVDAVVLDDAALPGVLIGMSFLNQLKKFEVRDGEMLLDD